MKTEFCISIKRENGRFKVRSKEETLYFDNIAFINEDPRYGVTTPNGSSYEINSRGEVIK